MEFTCETVYDQKAMTDMARALRKTIRKKRSRRSHILGWIIIAAALLITLPLGGRPFTLDARTFLNWAAALAVGAVLLLEDTMNGYGARKRLMAGTGQSHSVFREDSYRTETGVGATEWNYSSVAQVAETRQYFVFLFDQSHAQVYDKSTLSGGSPEEFRSFIAQKTGKEVQQIS